jgi:hypothetical protein
VCGALGEGHPQKGCDPNKVSTSYRNKFYGNRMGRSPAGRRDPNGLDFWWDSFPGNTGNCWYGNTGPDGRQGSVRTVPGTLPSDCRTSVGRLGLGQETELLSCFLDFDSNIGDCPWFKTPAEPR